MLSIEWVLVAVLACLAVAFAVLWQRARKQAPAAASATGLSPDSENTLLAIGQVDIAGISHHHGVVSANGAPATSFLVAQNMGHLQTGDVFSMRNGQAYKVEKRAAAAETAAVTQTAVASAAPVAAPADDDAAGRTVLYLDPNQGAATAATPDLEYAFAYLKVIEGADAGVQFPLPYADAGIGRSEDNVVTLSDDGASRQHCRIEFNGTDFVLRDLESTNGTLHNGELTDQSALEFGDRIEVADSVMVFTCEGFELKDSDPERAIRVFEHCLDQEPDFLLALKNLAFLLERDVRRKKEAEPMWQQISRLEKGR